MNNKFADETRSNLLKSAMNVLISKGYTATRLEDIAIEAGVTRGAISYHFKNKLNIYNEALKIYIPGLFEDFNAVVKSDLNSTDKIQKLLHWLLDSERIHIVQMLQQLLRGEFKEQAPELHNYVKEIIINCIDLTEAIILEGIDSSEFRNDVNPKASAFIFNNAVVGIIDNLDLTANYIAKEVMINQFLEIFLEGIKN